MIGANLVRAGLLALLGVLLVAVGARAYSEEENLAYIENILNYLNNNYECNLPTYNEVDELQKCFHELEQAWGVEFESRLSEDQKLVKKTILLHWDSFQKHMTSAVIVRSAKKRAFLCKIEDYQEAKFGDSVCTRIKDIKGPITNHIFEKNPIVRYIKHIETGQVIERPVDVPPPPPPTTMLPPTELPLEPTTTELPEPTTTVLPEPTTTVLPEPTTTVLPEPTTTELPEPTTTEVPIATTTVEPTTPPCELPTTTPDEPEVPDERLPEGEAGKPRDEHEQEGIQHTYIGKFTIDFSKLPDKFSIDFEREKSKNDDINRDPLDDIPVPSSTDDDQAAGGSAKKDSEPESASSTTTTTALPMFDEFGAEYIEEDYDDAQLERLVRAPKRDWQFDPVFGYFKWPDECNADMCPAHLKLDDSMLVLNGVWFQFAADPYAYDAHLESIRPTTTTTARPKINAGLLRKQKHLFDQSIQDDSRRGQIFGWNNERAPKKIELYMPEIKRDRWINLADNNFCKLNYNKDYLKNKGKKGFRAVKNLFTSADQLDSLKAREGMLAAGPVASGVY